MQAAFERQMISGRLRHWYRVLLFLAVVVFFAAFYFFSSITVPFMIPVIMAYLLSPLVRKMHQHGIPRFLAALIILFIVIAVIFTALAYVLPMFFHEVKTLAGNTNALNTNLRAFEQRLSEALPLVNWKGIRNDLSQYVETVFSKVVKSIPNILENMVTLVYFLVIIPFLLFFFLKDGNRIIRRLIGLVPNRFFEMTAYMIDEIDTILGRFLRGIFIENTIIATLAITGLSIIGLKNAVLIGTLIGLFNVIPYMGPTIGFIIGSIVVIVDPMGNPSLLSVLVVISIVQLMDNVIVYPIAIGKSVNVHPISVIASLLVGGFFLGIIGMLLAVPIMTSLGILFRTFNRALREYRLQ